MLPLTSVQTDVLYIYMTDKQSDGQTTRWYVTVSKNKPGASTCGIWVVLPLPVSPITIAVEPCC